MQTMHLVMDKKTQVCTTDVHPQVRYRHRFWSIPIDPHVSFQCLPSSKGEDVSGGKWGASRRSRFMSGRSLGVQITMENLALVVMRCHCVLFYFFAGVAALFVFPQKNTSVVFSKQSRTVVLKCFNRPFPLLGLCRHWVPLDGQSSSSSSSSLSSWPVTTVQLRFIFCRYTPRFLDTPKYRMKLVIP